MRFTLVGDEVEALAGGPLHLAPPVVDLGKEDLGLRRGGDLGQLQPRGQADRLAVDLATSDDEDLARAGDGQRLRQGVDGDGAGSRPRVVGGDDDRGAAGKRTADRVPGCLLYTSPSPRD